MVHFVLHYHKRRETAWRAVYKGSFEKAFRLPENKGRVPDAQMKVPIHLLSFFEKLKTIKKKYQKKTVCRKSRGQKERLIDLSTEDLTVFLFSMDFP